MKITQLRLAASDLLNMANLGKALNDMLARLQNAIASAPSRQVYTVRLNTQVTFADSFPVVLTNPGFEVECVTVGQATYADSQDNFTVAVFPTWQRNAAGDIVITYLTGLVAEKLYLLTIEVTGG